MNISEKCHLKEAEIMFFLFKINLVCFFGPSKWVCHVDIFSQLTLSTSILYWAMKLMTGLVEVAVTVSVQLQTTQRQRNMENSKSSDDRASDRLEKLEATISEVTHTHTTHTQTQTH